MTTWRDIDPANCSVQGTLDIIGEKWTILLIRDAANGVRRFDDFRRHVGLSEAVLATRLRRLVEAGLFETREYQEPGQRARLEYRVTTKGWDLFPVLIALMQWGDRHLTEDGQGPWSVTHAACGHPVTAEVRCSHDHQQLTHRDTNAGPGANALILKGKS